MSRARQVTRRWRLLISLMLESSPGATVAAALSVIGQAVCVVTFMIASGRLVTDLASGASTSGPLAVVLGALVAAPVLAAVHAVAVNALQERATVVTQDRLVETVMSPNGIEHLEAPSTAAEIDGLGHIVRDQYFRGVEAAWSVVAARVAGVGALVVLMGWSWPCALLAGAGHAWFGSTWSRYLSRIWEDMDAVDGDHSLRRSNWFRSILVSSHAAKEVRMFGLQPFLLDHMTASWQAAMSVLWRRRRERLRPVLAAAVAMVAAQAVVLVVLARQAWAGEVSIGTVITAVQALLAVEALGALGDSQAILSRALSMVARLDALRAALVDHEQPSVDDTEPHVASDDVVPSAIDVRGLCFSYPEGTEPVLDGVDLLVPAGQSIAIVGLNGAGKSTFVKLLCGLYEPTSGVVLIGGRDPRREGGRNDVAVIFQDFVHYELALLDNVDLAAAGSGEDDRRVERARRALDEVGGASILERVGSWTATLSPSYEGGTELSGGQWQRVAIARAVVATESGAKILVLDEPTSALDVRLEHELFDRFLDAAQDRTTVLVSHRLSAVRRADRILVLADGRIVEDGSHDELMALNGRYAELFRTQAERFRNSDEKLAEVEA